MDWIAAFMVSAWTYVWLRWVLAGACSVADVQDQALLD